jgi:hypothetical protein
MSVMVALTEANKENGCLQVIKGSHKLGRVNHGFAGEQVGADMVMVENALKTMELVYCELEPGDALFFHSNLLHRSAANLSDRPRWSIIACYNSQSNIEVYTLLSSPQFGRQYKGPQENLPLDLMEKVAMEMLHSLENALHIDRGAVIQNVVDLKLQLWGAAVPINTWKSGKHGDGFVYDAQYGVGACGDWILDSSIAGAWESGRRLANWIVEEQQHEDGHEIKNWSVGLPNLSSENANHSGGKFVPSRAALESGIGTIPSTTPDSSGEVTSYNTHDGKKSFDSRRPSRNAGRGSGSSRRQHSAGNNRGRNNAGANSGGGGRGRNIPNGGGKSQPVTR